MNGITRITPADFTQSSAGPPPTSSMSPPERLARFLGWFSIGLGVAELAAPARITRALGMEGKEGLIRAYGVRELVAGVPTLTQATKTGLASRIMGDVLDLATLATALRPSNPRRSAALAATALVAGIMVLDIIAAAGVAKAQARTRKLAEDYRVGPTSSRRAKATSEPAQGSSESD